MSQNSNLSNNSPALTHHGSPTTICVNNNTSFTTQLLNKFNTRQEHHISISSTSLVQYAPSSPTSSVQEIALPPPLHICIYPDPKGPHLPMSPRTAETILHRTWVTTFKPLHAPWPTALSPPYADQQPSLTSTSKRPTTASTNSMGSYNNKRPKSAISKTEAGTSTCPPPTSGMEDE